MADDPEQIDKDAWLREQIARIDRRIGEAQSLPLQTKASPLWPYPIFGLISGATMVAAGMVFAKWLDGAGNCL